MKVNQSGFALLESVVSLLVLSMIISLGMFAFRICAQSQQCNNDSEILMFTQELESKKHDFKLMTVKNDELKLYSKSEQKYYWLAQYKNMLRFTPGHMPVLSNVQSCQFKKTHGLIEIDLILNQKHYQREVYIES